MEKKKDWEQFFIDVMEKRQKGVLPTLLRVGLWVLSWGYGLGIACRNWAFDRGLFKRYQAPVPAVLSIGNIVTGGTGKTPLTKRIAEHFAKDFKVAILSRGYRSAAENLSSPVVLSDGDGPLYPANYCGDEAYLLAKALQGVRVFVGRDRRKASILASKRGVQVLVLDDGMQYRHLARDFEVVVMDATDPFGLGHLLPRGFLRESARGLKRADLIVLNHVHDRGQLLTVKHQLSRYTSAPIVAMRPVISQVVDRKGKVISSMQGKKVGVFCGIAKPHHFHRLLKDVGVEVVAEEVALDHCLPTYQQIAAFAKKSVEAGASMLVCTEKDWVKIPDTWSLPLPLGIVEMELEIVEGEEDWSALIENIRSCVLHDVALAGQL